MNSKLDTGTKKILVLGAGIYQVPLLRKIKEMGYYAIVSSIPGDYPGFEVADKVYYEDTTDYHAILKIAEDEHIDAILTTGTDVAVKTIGYVCDKLSLNGISFNAAEKVTNKYLMKNALEKGQSQTASFRKIGCIEDLKPACKELSFPLMVKCVDKSGSRGIIKVEDENNLVDAYKYAMNETKLDYVLVEEFIDGYEIGVDGFFGREDVYVFPHDKILFYNGCTNVPVGHVFPYNGSDEILGEIKIQIEKAGRALGLKNCFFNADVMISDDKVFIIEIGARCGATCIPELLSLYLNVDYYGLMIENSLGRIITFPKMTGQINDVVVGKLLFVEKTGYIERISYNIKNKSQLKQLEFDYQVGDYVSSFRVGPDRIGQIIVQGVSVSDAMSYLKRVEKEIEIDIKTVSE